MRYVVRRLGVPLGSVELPAGRLVAGRLEPLPAYAAIDRVVRRATESFFQVGIFGAAALDLPGETSLAHRHRWAMRRAAALDIELLGAEGDTVETTFVNLLAGGEDSGVIVLACFVGAGARQGAAMGPADRGGTAQVDSSTASSPEGDD